MEHAALSSDMCTNVLDTSRFGYGSGTNVLDSARFGFGLGLCAKVLDSSRRTWCSRTSAFELSMGCAQTTRRDDELVVSLKLTLGGGHVRTLSSRRRFSERHDDGL